MVFDHAQPERADTDGVRGDFIDKTIHSYDNSADDYAEWSNSYDLFPEVREMVTQFREQLPPGLPILDAGCGAGRDARELALGGVIVVAVDLSEKMLRTWPTTTELSAHRVLGDLSRLPIRRATLGGIWACASLIHQPVDALPTIVSRLVDLLVPGGAFWASMRSEGLSGFCVDGAVAGPRWQTVITPPAFTKILDQVGLSEINHAPSGPRWFTAWGTKPVP